MDFQRFQKILHFQAKPKDFYLDFAVGDFVKVHCLLVDTKKKRIQIFSGLVIAICGSLNAKSFRVWKTSGDFSVEKTFFYNSPLVTKVEIVQKGKVRRSKIYYIRKLKGKAARIKKVNPILDITPSKLIEKN